MTVSARDIFLDAVERAPADWPKFLDRACQNDATLRAAVQRLLDAHLQVDSFMAQPAVGTAETIARSATPQIGTSIGRYKLLEELGAGGMGVVYVAEQTVPVRRKVALKVIRPGMDTRQVIARFEAERQALAMMDHPHIAKVLDAGTTDTGHPYFVMELVRGLPITDYCDKAKLPPKQRLELFATVCQAVQHAHQRGIIHRDLKPGNVLVTLHDGVPVPKVIDFGIAKAVGQSLTELTLHTGLMQLIGTPLYMSPEQAEMSGLDIDTRSDVYSLGVLLYELLTGHTPFDKKTLQAAGEQEMRRIIREQEPPRPSQKVSSLSGEPLSTASRQRGLDERRLSQVLRGELDWIVMKALDKDRNRRYESPSTFAADVQRYLQHEPVEASPPSSWYRVRKYARRHRGALTTVFFIVFALLTGTGVSAWQAYEATVARRLADARLKEAEDERKVAAASYEKARETIKKLLEQTGTQQIVRIPGMREVYVRLLDEAISSYRELTKLKPDDPENYLQLGSLYLEKADAPAALQQYEQALEVSPSDPRAHFGLAQSLEASWLPTVDEAMVNVAEGTIAESALPQVHADIGERALRHSGEAIKRMKEAPVSYLLLHAKILYRLDRSSEARKILLEVERRGALTADDKAALAEAANDLGDYQRSLRLAQQALRQDPDHHFGYFQLGESNRLAGHYEKALEAYERSLALDPLINHQNRLEVLQKRADVNLNLARYQTAEEDCTVVLERDPTRWLLFKRRALARFHLKNFAGALSDLRQARDLWPDDHTTLSWIRPALVMKCGNPEFVAGIFDLAASSPTALGRLHAARADWRAEQEDYDGAMEDVLRGVELRNLAVCKSSAFQKLSTLGGRYSAPLTSVKKEYQEALESQLKCQEGYFAECLQNFGPYSYRTRTALLSRFSSEAALGQQCTEEGRRDEAVALASRSFEDCRRVFGDGQSWTLIARNNLALFCVFAGRYSQAEDLLGPGAADGALDELDGRDTRTYHRKRVLGLALLRQGKLDAAEAQFNQAREIARAQDDMARYALSSEFYLAYVAYERGDFASTERQLKECLPAFQDVIGPHHTETLDALDLLALAYEGQGHFAELELLAREYWESCKRHKPDSHKTSHAQSLLGASLAGLEKHAEAEQLLLSAFQVLQRCMPRGYEVSRDTIQTARRLAKLYEVKGDSKESERWQQKILAEESRWPPDTSGSRLK